MLKEAFQYKLIHWNPHSQHNQFWKQTKITVEVKMIETTVCFSVSASALAPILFPSVQHKKISNPKYWNKKELDYWQKHKLQSRVRESRILLDCCALETSLTIWLPVVQHKKGEKRIHQTTNRHISPCH